MLGEFCYKAKSTFFLNDKTERVDKANVINQILNWKATQQPDFQSLTMAPFIKDFVRAWVGQGADLSEYIQAPQPPQTQSLGAEGAPPQNPGPQPGQQPPSAPPATPAAPQEQMVYPKRYLTPAPARPQ
jgi:hypothetical protein